MLGRRGSIGSPRHEHVGSLKAHDGGVDRRHKLLQRSVLRIREVVALLPVAEILVDDGNGLVGVEVAGKAYRHVVWHVVAMEIVFYVGYGRVLQVFLRADGALRAIRMTWEELLAHGLNLLLVIAAKADVVFLIHRLQLSVEAAYDHVLEPVGLHLGPGVYLVGRDVLHIARDILRGVGVAALRSNARHELVILVGDVIPGGQLRYGVNLVVSLLPHHGVGDVAITLEATLYGVEQRGLSRHVA